MGFRTSNVGNLPRLRVSLPDGEESSYPLIDQQTTIGRDPANHICLTDHFVSKFHAQIIRVGDVITIRDLGSVNYTRVNGEVVERAVLRYGDDIQFAGVRCRLLPPESAPVAERGLAPAGASEHAGEHDGIPVSGKSPSTTQRLARPARVARKHVLLAVALVSTAFVGALATRLTPLKDSVSFAPPGTTEASRPGASAPDAVRLTEERERLRGLLAMDPKNSRVRARLEEVESDIGRAIELHATRARDAHRTAIAEWERVLRLAEPSDLRYLEAHRRIEAEVGREAKEGSAGSAEP